MDKMAVKKFIKDLKKTCKEASIKLILKDAKFLLWNEDEKCGGYFAYDLGELHCAFPKKIELKYVEVLIHESCHLDQWLMQTPKWVANIKSKSSDIFFNSLEDNTKCPKEAFHVRNIQLMEAECEKMSVQKIKDLKLNINLEKYIKKANAYLLFYTLLKETRIWSDYSPYKFKEIWDKMPGDKILNNFSMSEELKDLYKLKCYKKRRLLYTK